MDKIKQIIQDNLAIIVFGIFIAYLVYTNRSQESLENTDASLPVQPAVVEAAPAMAQPQNMTLADDVANKQADPEANAAQKADLSAEDLLPKYDEANEFAKENPVSKLLKEQNFLISGHHTGINTVMQSNKIPYHDIRSMPPIPKENTGPWSQSSYEQSPAQMRRFFEIGL